LSRKEFREEFSDEQIEKLLEYKHYMIEERIKEIKNFVKTYPTFSMALFFSLGLIFGIYFSENT